MAYLTFLTGIAISAIAIYYSVMGLAAIFAAAVVPIVIMGTVLEVAKLVTTIWLKQNWSKAPKMLKTYLSISVAILMLITSMGIFGFLSKAHLDQGVPTSDIAASVALIDEKIKTERDNIEAARKALAQMDATVDQTISRSSNEQGANRAAQLRRSQAKERSQLQAEIASAQKKIAALNEERAPIAKDLRKVEAEVGPIKYIAALIYGDNPDQNLLEKAVTWVIITIIFVFDPLAVLLLLASQYSFVWARENKQEIQEPIKQEPSIALPPETEESPQQLEPVKEEIQQPINEQEIQEVEETSLDDEEPELIEEVTPKQLEEEVKAIEAADTDDAETSQIKAAKRKWKAENPDGSLHVEERRKQLGLIKTLPWEEEGYVQNSEQSNETLWQRLSKRQK